MSTIGIDPSVDHPAFALWPQRETWRIDILGQGAARLRSLYAAAHDWAALSAPDDLEAVFIERPFGRFQKQALDQASGVLQVAVLNGLAEQFPHPVSCFELSTGTWKKAALGNGAAKKHEVGKWARNRVWHVKELPPPSQLTQDEADALAIAYAGARLLEQGEAA